MRELVFREALREALIQEMRRDPKVFLIGEDIGKQGGAYKVSAGILDEFGPTRVVETPISESAIAGAGVGAALTGMRPVVEIMYSDFLGICMDEVMNKMAKWRYMHGSTMSVPMVLRTSCGGGFGGAAEHSQSLEALFMHIPGLRVAYPATPYDAKGLMKTLLREDNPSLFFEHRLLYRTKGMIPEEEYYLPLGKAEIMKEGTDVTLVAIGLQVLNAMNAAQQLEGKGIKAEVIDLRMVAPLDKETLLTSVEKTGRLVVVEEGVKTGGVGAELAAIVAEEGLFLLRSPVKRVASLDLPIPYSPPMEKYVLPNADKIIAAVNTAMQD